MGLDKNNIPDEYLCEVCKPRPIDRKRAKAMQSRRRTEIFNNSSSSDDGGNSGNRKKHGAGPDGKKRPGDMGPNANNKKILDRKADGIGGKKHPKIKKGGSLLTPTSTNANNKKQYRKRKPSETAAGGKKISPKKSATARRKSQANDSDLDSGEENADMEPMIEQTVRSWIDHYEEAVTNHYSPELRARLAGNRLSGIGSDLRPNVLGGPTRCNVSLKGNGVKVGKKYFQIVFLTFYSYFVFLYRS